MKNFIPDPLLQQPRPKFESAWYQKTQPRPEHTTMTQPKTETPQHSPSISTVIRNRLLDQKQRYWAGDNISACLEPGDKDRLIEEATWAFEQVLDSLVIDRDTDPNSQGTARRLAKMYFKIGRAHV